MQFTFSLVVCSVLDIPVCSLHCLAILMSCLRKPCTTTVHTPLSSPTFPIAQTVTSIPSLFTDPHWNSFRWTAEPTEAGGSNQTQKYCPGSSESQPPETFNHEVNPNHLKSVQSPASREEERKWLSRVQKETLLCIY